MDKTVAQFDQKLPFVVYRKPKEKSVSAVFQHDDSLHHVKDFKERGFLFAPFDDDQPSILILADEFKEAAYDVEGKSPGYFDRTAANNTDRQFHLELVKKGIEHIEKGEFQKVVLSRRVDVDCHTSPIELFQKLLATYQNALCYLWYHPKVGTWLGATPEILLKVENQSLTSMSLAGTQKFEGDFDPTWGKKELKEQEMVTGYVTEALKNKVSSLKISPRETTRAGDLLHLRTKLTGTIVKDNLPKIVEALHPTPAVCGMPMKASKDFILENENYNREFYTGYLGELNFKHELKRPFRRKNQEHRAYKTIKTTTTLFVNLRCMQLKDGQAQIYVGGGVTQDSIPEKEWDETVAKANTMLKVLQGS